MAQCVQSVQELIPDSFVPCVAALCSDEAERLTRLNHLSFAELLKPFSRLTSEVHMRDPNNQLHIIKNLKIAVSNIITQPPQPGAVRKLLNDVVSGSQPAEGLVANVITAGDYDLNISGMLVASSSEAEPVEQFSKLSQEQHRIQHNNDYSYPKWFIPNTLKYYVLLHDVSAGDEQRAESIYEEMKQKYGTQGCYLLKINSRTSNRASDEQIPDPWSQYLQKNSIQNQESCEDGPCTVTSNKNSDSNLLSLDGLDNDVKVDGLPNNFRVHPLQLDQSRDRANSIDGPDYVKSPSLLHEAKKTSTGIIHGACLTLTDHDRIRQFIQEFTFRGLLPHIEKTIRQLNDQEMAAVSAFLQPGAPRPYPAHYMDTAIQTYRDICKNMVLAERCVLLSAEILKSQSKYSEAAALLIRLTSEKRHALRCYCQAMQVYKGKGWSLAEDHINFTIGRQSYTLRQLDNAVSAFRHILINESKQSAAQQGAFLREYLYVYKNVSQLSPDGPLPQLPLPYINSSATRVFFGHDRRPADGEKQAATHVSLDQEYDTESSQQWRELEEQVVAVVNKGIIPSNFHPTQYCLNSYSDNSRFPLAVVEEPITVEVAFRNPLKVPLLLTDLSLLWKFQPKDFSGKDNEVKELARLKLFPHHIGELHILGVVYNLGTIQGSMTVDGIGTLPGCHTGKHSLSMSVRGRQDLEIQGPRLNNTKEEKASIKYGPDRRLDPIITEEMPLLEVFFIHFPTGLLCGEIRKAYVEFVNVSKCPLTGLKVVCKRPEFFTFGGNTAVLTPLSPSASENCSAYKTVVTDPTSVCTALISSASSVDFGIGIASQPEVIPVPLPDTVLLPGASVQLPMWLRGPDEEGVHEINFLFYYESVKKQPKIHHRILRHTAVICTSRSLNVRATVCRSNSLEDEEGRGDNMLVFVDVENTNTSEAGVKEFHIVQVSSSSKHWKLQKSVNLSENKAATQSLEKYTFADIIFGNEQIVSSASPCADFFYRSLSSELKKPQAQLSVHTEKQSIEDAVKLIQMCSEVDLNIIILWKAYVVEDSKQLILEGQHHVILHTIGKEAFSYPQKQEPPEMELLKFFRPENTTVPSRPSVEQLSNLIKTSLHYPESFSHPFHQKSLCLVPVTLLLSNCSQADVDVIVDLRHKTTSPESLEIHGSFTWLGQTQYKLHLKSQEIHSLQLKACFVHTGVYNLGTPRVFAKLSDQVTVFETSQQNSMPALIIINNV
ncbi:Trafficking protein particle complex subunit 8 [Tupaia chinensis]|uniref:Trafficking protein particle complex subunit 8 n=1 Tax=Tupaia chinensis TaxID=246437 RepID=L9KNW7_TUPCH|nr:Trafficking protein particle complex subunit 8 [Tupaia chinensis]